VRFFEGEDVAGWLKMALASGLSGLVSWGSMRVLDMFVFETSRAIPLLALTVVSVLMGLATYLILARLFKFKELGVVLGLGKRISQWRKTLFAVEEMIEPHPDTVGGV
jgi:hypothetical protein